MEERDRGPQDVGSPPFPSCWYILNVFASFSELVLDLLTISLAAGVPASPKTYPRNTMSFFVTNCFYRLLETSQRPSPTSEIPIARVGLRNLATSHRHCRHDTRSHPHTIFLDHNRRDQCHDGIRLSPAETTISLPRTLSAASSERRPARLNSPTPSVGVVATRFIEIEPEKDRWWRITRDWYAQVVAEYPGRGKLHHHHLGILSREAEGEELRGIYHLRQEVSPLCWV